MSDGPARAQRGRDEHSFSQLRFRRTHFPRTVRMDIDAIGALRRKGDPQCDQFLVLFGNGSVGQGGLVEGDKRRHRFRCQGDEVFHLVNIAQIV